MSMALVMSEMPDVYRRVLSEHVPDAGGRCSACRNVSGETGSWPCQTYHIAQEAKRVSEGNLPGAGPDGSVNPLGGSTPATRSEPSSSLDTPHSGEVPELGFSGRPEVDAPGPRLDTVRPEGGRRRRRDDDDDSASFGTRTDAPYGSSFGVDDRARHAAHEVPAAPEH